MLERPFNDQSYEQFLQEELIMGAKCKKCGTLALPPRPLCVSCFSREQEWVQFKGTGKLTAFTSIVVAPPTMAKEGFNRNNPYIVGVVTLDEGPKMVVRIVGVDAKKPDGIAVGSPLKAEFVHSGEASDRKTYVAFKP
ncbi:MAG: Zn-ribbon domain-containing OB-fold protein [Deltaproteobacteria bacterium]|nr:Zn-ribbon domain-containing OB-fold protein [Deltaproteobacteria bacterium]